MGEYAEMMLSGECCEGCGNYIGMGQIGLPQYCSKRCANDRGAYWPEHKPQPITKTKCPECGKRVKMAGLKDHLRDMHGAKKP